MKINEKFLFRFPGSPRVAEKTVKWKINAFSVESSRKKRFPMKRYNNFSTEKIKNGSATQIRWKRHNYLKLVTFAVPRKNTFSECGAKKNICAQFYAEYRGAKVIITWRT